MLRIINDHLLPLGKHNKRSKRSCHSLYLLTECLSVSWEWSIVFIVHGYP